MPLKTFKCKNCGSEFQEIVDIDDKEIQCPVCGFKILVQESIIKEEDKVKIKNSSISLTDNTLKDGQLPSNLEEAIIREASLRRQLEEVRINVKKELLKRYIKQKKGVMVNINPETLNYSLFGFGLDELEKVLEKNLKRKELEKYKEEGKIKFKSDLEGKSKKEIEEILREKYKKER